MQLNRRVSGSFKFSYYPESLCAGNSTEVVVAIRSGPGREVHRTAIRHSMAHPAFRWAFPNWAFLFYTGFLNDSASLDALRREISMHGDLLVAPYVSTPNNSVKIALEMMRWVDWCCGKGRPTRLFVHLNDTVFVDAVALERYSEFLNKSGRPCFYCKVVKGVDVGRDPQDVNFVPRHLFRNPVFPPYCEGSAFFINGTHLGPLYAASLSELHYALVPQYLTGHMAAKAGMGHVDISQEIAVVGSPDGGEELWERDASKTRIFFTGIRKNMWKYVWLHSLYNQTRGTKHEKDMVQNILARLWPSSG